MFDVDGVPICHPDPAGWSVHLHRDLGLSPDILQEAFFKPHWDDVIHGRAGLRERLAPVLVEIAPHLDCARLIEYWFAADAHLNRPLLAEVEALRKRGLPVHLATLQEHERARYLWDVLDFGSRFDAMHYAADLGAAKPNRDFFVRIEQRTGLAPADLFLVDDRPRNVEAARACGWGAAHWTGQCSLHDMLVDVLGRV